MPPDSGSHRSIGNPVKIRGYARSCEFRKIVFMANFSIWEVLFLLCFAVSWPVSIAKSLRTKMVIGKSPFFMSLVILGYIFGIIHKALYSHDIVIWLYVFNAVLVATDLVLYFTYIGRNRRELQQSKPQ